MKESDQQPVAPEVLEPGRRVVSRIRAEANAEYAHFSGAEGEDVFQTLYLSDRHGCIPDHLIGDDLLLDIHALYYQVFGAICEELEERFGREHMIWVLVDPSYEDTTSVAVCTERDLLLLHWSKAWNFYWDNEEAMARELGELYLTAAERLRASKTTSTADGT